MGSIIKTALATVAAELIKAAAELAIKEIKRRSYEENNQENQA